MVSFAPGRGTRNPLPDVEEPEGKKEGEGWWKGTAFKMFEAAMTTAASITVLGIVGYSYNRYYKHLVLSKMENAFAPGDPVLELAAQSHAYHVAEDAAKRRALRESVQARRDADGADPTDHDHWLPRAEQAKIDRIVAGDEVGHYHLLIGEKGTGKSSMLIDAMSKVDGEGIAMFDAHADVEIFRVRLGKALDFEYHEDNIGSLFSIRGPRDASALLDVERALNKLEKVALKRRRAGKKPLVLIVNSMHLLRDDDDGRDLLELVQQRAELWAASTLATVVFNSDDYWVYERLKQYSTRMEVTPVGDLPKDKALDALKRYRMRNFGEEPDGDVLEKVYESVGGRLTFLSRVAKNKDMLKVCEDINEREKTWFLNQTWILGEEMDDDVMDQQKYASAAMVLAKALVDKEREMAATYDAKSGHILPSLPLWQARQVMTRADFIQSYDHINIFTIDSKANVRADSVPMMNAFRDVCSREGFDEHLEKTLTRIGDIESLGRTREVTIKDLWEGGKYRVVMRDAKGRVQGETTFETVEKKDDGDD
ncbi:hypothetical protein BDY21DRAFT_415943 [Lineolata rhizophorae]|uniref:AAA protein C-terminal winged helix domain-containing protein n=1 Tax=Lineolata rhizophorae TaxID=578093 RepID=A0A6A6NWC3_9PEZI|nr:hypothetical protein BDY21DRAFT_415943 [Lineolata rhizophorae]